MWKPKYSPPVVKATSEFAPEQECKLPVVTLEALLKSEYVDPCWEVVQRQEAASEQANEIKLQIGNTISSIAIEAVWEHDDSFKRNLEIYQKRRLETQPLPQKVHKKKKSRLPTWGAIWQRKLEGEFFPTMGKWCRLGFYHEFQLPEAYMLEWEHPKKACKGPDKFWSRTRTKQSTILLENWTSGAVWRS